MGASGAGKSMLSRVLAGLYAAESVSIDQDGGLAILASSDVATFLRATTTLIPQDGEVFEASLGENLDLCAPLSGTAGSAEYLQALQVTCVDEFIALDARALESPWHAVCSLLLAAAWCCWMSPRRVSI